MDDYKSNMDFKRLIGHVIFYSNYSFFNALLVDDNVQSFKIYLLKDLLDQFVLGFDAK